MATTVYQKKDNGDLKLLAEIEESIEDHEAVELLVEEAPRLAKSVEEFVVISGDLDSGDVTTVSQKETVSVTWASSRNGVEAEEVPAPSRRRRAKAEPVEDDDEVQEEAPKPRRGRPPGSKNKPKETTKPASRRGRKPAAAKPAARGRSSAKKSGSPFKRNAASDE